MSLETFVFDNGKETLVLNGTGQTVLPTDDYNLNDDIYIRNIQDLGTVDFELAMATNPYISGATVNNKRANPREIVFEIGYKKIHKVTEVNEQIYEFLSNAIDSLQKVTILKRMPSGNYIIEKSIQGTISKIEPEIFTDEPVLQITFSCDSFWSHSQNFTLTEKIVNTEEDNEYIEFRFDERADTPKGKLPGYWKANLYIGNYSASGVPVNIDFSLRNGDVTTGSISFMDIPPNIGRERLFPDASTVPTASLPKIIISEVNGSIRAVIINPAEANVTNTGCFLYSSGAPRQLEHIKYHIDNGVWTQQGSQEWTDEWAEYVGITSAEDLGHILFCNSQLLWEMHNYLWSTSDNTYNIDGYAVNEPEYEHCRYIAEFNQEGLRVVRRLYHFVDDSSYDEKNLLNVANVRGDLLNRKKAKIVAHSENLMMNADHTFGTFTDIGKYIR